MKLKEYFFEVAGVKIFGEVDVDDSALSVSNAMCDLTLAYKVLNTALHDRFSAHPIILGRAGIDNKGGE